MTAKKLMVALALLVSATSAALAQGHRHARSVYDYSPSAFSAQAGSGAVFEDPQHGAGIASQR